eukprot:5298186-Pleurochrysis_carterae.AAC.1
MREGGCAPTVISYNLALDACAKASAGEAAMEMLAEMRARNLKPDVVSYSCVIAAFSKLADVPRVLGLLGAMEVPNASCAHAFAPRHPHKLYPTSADPHLSSAQPNTIFHPKLSSPSNITLSLLHSFRSP